MQNLQLKSVNLFSRANLDKVLFLSCNIVIKNILVYKTSAGKCPFEEWFYKLDKTAQARIEKRLERVKENNYGDFKKLNSNISELRFDFGSGYRIYFTEFNNIIILLLCAGDKSTQQNYIKKAETYLIELINRNN